MKTILIIFTIAVVLCMIVVDIVLDILDYLHKKIK